MITDPAGFASLSDLLDWCERAPEGTHLDARIIAEIIAPLADTEPASEPGESEPFTWRERLWVVPAETRLGVTEVAESLARPKSFVYERTGPKAEDPMPCRKLDGTILVFLAGELREWIEDREEVVHCGPMEKRGLHAV